MKKHPKTFSKIVCAAAALMVLLLANGASGQDHPVTPLTCSRGYNVAGHCTHGPDPAPAGVDVGRKRSTNEIVADSAATTSNAAVPCYGDGSSGNRIQVVYAHGQDVPDRFDALRDALVGWVGNVDLTFNDSAAATGGTTHVRWVTDADCNIAIQRVTLSATGDDSFSNTVSGVKALGLNRTDRKYLIWVDATKYCGISTLTNDDRPDQTNANNRGPSYARIDSGCWGSVRSTEAHELMHMLGGVQYTTPHTSGGGHCTDEYDRMCYADSLGVTVTYPCAATSYERLFDCNHDDYFSTNPPVGSYLATHWNTATSSFLEGTAVPVTTTTTSTTAPTTTTTIKKGKGGGRPH